MKTSAPKTRHELALEMAKESGVCYFNPFIGNSAAKTCEKLNDGLEIIHHLLANDLAPDGNIGLALFVQTMWAAAQFEGQIGGEVDE